MSRTLTDLAREPSVVARATDGNQRDPSRSHVRIKRREQPRRITQRLSNVQARTARFEPTAISFVK